WDPVAAGVCRILVQALDGPAVLAGFSRLLIDPNRPLSSDTLIRPDCDGLPVSFNQGLSDGARQARIDRFYRPYHARAIAVLQARRARGPVLLVGIHSFTPSLRGEARPMDFGVLCTDDGARAAALCQALAADGWRAQVNAPYSGHDGFMHAGDTHAAAAGDVPVLMIEIRQDHLREGAGVARMAQALARALPAVAP
ncbi:MAG: N-formylglutamate amidohydrolase, partial [Myxococcales bacterium]|nr:N-formylglutamate amidohydrolase [Myxococcales bacterium]